MLKGLLYASLYEQIELSYKWSFALKGYSDHKSDVEK